eukprot:m.793236 g.793236  ORF g.793236 m.793236 type:complete len:439 (+) comp59227_c0_seq2:243-1559(+)
MMDDFESAVRLLYDPAAGAEAKEAALTYIENLKQAPGAAWFCAHAFFTDAYADPSTRFVCLQVMESAWKTSYLQLDADTRNSVRLSLLKWLRECTAKQEPAFLRNKVAQIFVLVFEHEYPAQWPSFFQDIIELFELGEVVVDMFIRILDTIDESFVDREYILSEQQLVLSGQLKDAMRDNSLTVIAQTWLHILTSYESVNDVLVSSCLETIAKYISWIDIRFALDPQLLDTLFRFMASVPLREHACECFVAMVDKGMDPLAKLELVRSLNLLTLIEAISQNVVEDPNYEFQFRLAQLVNAIGVQLLSALPKLQAAGDDPGLLVATLDATHEHMFQFMLRDDRDVCSAVLPYATQFVHFLKQTSVRSRTVSGFSFHGKHFHPAYQVLALCSKLYLFAFLFPFYFFLFRSFSSWSVAISNAARCAVRMSTFCALSYKSVP